MTGYMVATFILGMCSGAMIITMIWQLVTDKDNTPPERKPLTTQQHKIYQYLKANQPVTEAKIAKDLHTSEVTVHNQLVRMNDMGYVTYDPDAIHGWRVSA